VTTVPTPAAYRRTGADLPWNDPVAPHGVAMEGWFWRITDAASGRAAIVLCGVCRGPAGEWTLVGLAGAPGGGVRYRLCGPATIGADGRTIDVAGGVLHADGDELRVDLGEDARLHARFASPTAWPRRRNGALGLGHLVPGLGQYWYPHLLGARVDGEMALDGSHWSFANARGYAEKNWGGGFPRRWWWGQASGVGDDDSACVAFAGGEVKVGALGLSPTAVVIRLNGDLLRLGPPFAHVQSDVSDGSWRLRARSARHTVELHADANGSVPHRLPVPVPAERRVVAGPSQYFTGRLAVDVRRGRRTVFSGESELAALERGNLSQLEPVG
jgi:hypothetical protein